MVYSVSQLQTEIQRNPEQWRPLVLTNGCFDLLHVGHVRYLKTAKALGKMLVVGVNSDRSVQRIKPQKPGCPLRPIFPEQQRAEVLSALTVVDAVVIFPETTATELINAFKPDIYAKGGDYTLENLPEAKTVHSYGGEIQFVAVEVPTSTSEIIRKISLHG
ncbi:MAG: D-glycero-beta-D-manno-heptose 1-phosphate adenylyltransferase [Cyanobacteria bacterium SW_9_44_58]|nr:MAG: D-glycero-beta-D-manno-heptose 1-phosphate adenylyltransferase [Cyanobacteria bacterium SW_9_44_58]